MRIELKTVVYRTDEVFVIAERKKAGLVAGSCSKDSLAGLFPGKTGILVVAGSQMESLRPTMFRNRSGKKVIPNIIY